MTREEIKQKTLTDPNLFINLDNVNDYHVIHKDSFDEALNLSFIEGAKSATPYGGHNPNHFENFTSTKHTLIVDEDWYDGQS